MATTTKKKEKARKTAAAGEKQPDEGYGGMRLKKKTGQRCWPKVVSAIITLGPSSTKAAISRMLGVAWNHQQVSGLRDSYERTYKSTWARVAQHHVHVELLSESLGECLPEPIRRPFSHFP